ncbi:hypothetical protein AArcCO_4036 (plasmid) [Halalkaliarchaeum sp. AArc-CO]|uniref:DUF4209 domain-containing protein n=1 Tax=Halalkaliarchaeum sp. AArc-CO TaxID=2866381 RepID=UPI00217E8E2C|nr:DUF4209 domain-containing protein [Halalkaliarchaeum sp. AArc-CO]UWG49211.1 hypothetical protein AArcCO_4036 [Halalkaliarchaeum sp. AArc-CO]
MVRLLDALDRARSDPEKESHYALQLDRLFDAVRESSRLSENTRLQLDEMEDDNPLPELVDDLSEWYDDNQFQSALDALDQLETAIADAEQKDWLSVAAQYQYRRIQLRAGLQGHNAKDEIEEVLDFLLDHHEAISSTFITPIIEIVIENLDDLSESIKDRWVVLLENIADTHRANNRFNQERESRRLLRQFKQQDGRDTADVERTLIESYQTEASLMASKSQLQKADILQSGVAECGEYMDDEQRRDWKQEALQARRSGIESELTQIPIENLSEEDGDSLEDALLQEMEQNTETLVEWFKQVKQETGSSAYALYCLVFSSKLIPDVNKMRLTSEEFVISQLVQRRIYSPEAHSLAIDPTEVETIPNAYAQHAGSTMTSLGNALYQLINEGHLTPADVFQLFWIGDSLSPDTGAFLTDGILDLYDGNHLQALFVLMPHLEAAIVDTLQSIGRPAYSIVDRGTRQQLLGGLFRNGTEIFGQHYAVYLRWRYTSRQGMNLRNRLTHGQLRYSNANYLNAVLLLFDILKCMITINSSAYFTYFGVPSQALTPATNYGRDLDLSLYTDLNKQLIGYGQSDDGHTILVLRQDSYDDQIELFVDRGSINHYDIDTTDLTRDELIDRIDDLRADHPSIPENVDYTWLDTDDLVLHTIQKIIDEALDSPADSITQEAVLDTATTRGIDESTGRFALSMLDDRGEIITADVRGDEHILRTDEKLQVFETARSVDGVGTYRAWNIADHFESYTAFEDADSATFEQVDGIGPGLAVELSSLQ